MKKHFFCSITTFALLAFFACQKSTDTPTSEANLQFQFDFDAAQPRLNNLGQPAVIPAGHAAQTPVFHKMSVHYIELAPNALTALGQGAIVYKGAETTKGGENAVDFDKAAVSGVKQVFAKIKLKDVQPGTYTWARASVTYQNYDISFDIHTASVGIVPNSIGTIASFVGFNTYISEVQPNQKTLSVNDDKKQGFWAFETNLPTQYASFNNIYSGEAPAGATTVVNPLFASSPIPQGSCVVTGQFAQPLVVTGQETDDITVTLSFSINNSFEWEDNNGNGRLDFYTDPSTPSEKIVDMGLRGLVVR